MHTAQAKASVPRTTSKTSGRWQKKHVCLCELKVSLCTWGGVMSREGAIRVADVAMASSALTARSRSWFASLPRRLTASPDRETW